MEMQEGELVVEIVRQHWFVIIQPIIVAATLVVLVVAGGFYFQFDFFGYSSAAYLATGGIVLLALSYKFFLWRKNELVITNFRIINHQQRGLMSQTVTELLYPDITDISFTQDGPSAMAFNYGTLVIRLPSQEQIKVEMVPKPSTIMEIINRVRMANFAKSNKVV